MKLPLNTARSLLQLIEEGELPYSQFNRKLADKLLEDGVLVSSFLSRTRRTVRLKSLEYLNNYLFNEFHISDLSAYIQALNNEEAGRADFALTAGDSKLKGGSVFTGFMVNTYDEIYGTLRGERILLKPFPGSFLFINDYQQLSIPDEITVVVIENFENFKLLEKQRRVFPEGKTLFAWRYQNNALAEWLAKLPNPYLHFGDFDLPGLNIYLKFKEKRKGKVSDFLIPENIEELLQKYGSRERYLKQLEYTKNIDFNSHQEISSLAELIHKYQKSLEQEIFISLNS